MKRYELLLNIMKEIPLVNYKEIRFPSTNRPKSQNYFLWLFVVLTNTYNINLIEQRQQKFKHRSWEIDLFQVDMDLSQMDDSPVLWIRLDPDFTLIRSVEIVQPDFQWQYQLRHHIHNFAVQSSTVQYSTVQYSTVQYSTVQYSTVQYSTVLHIRKLRKKILLFTTLYPVSGQLFY